MPIAISGNRLRFLKKDWIQVKLPDEDKEIVLHRGAIFDLVTPAAYGLLDDLIPGTDLCEKFVELFQELPLAEDIVDAIEIENVNVRWFYYPRKHHLVRFISEEWHRLALLVRNSTLIQEPNRFRSWSEHRKIFDDLVIAVAGCSVGGNIAHAIVRDLRPKRIKIADPKDFYLHNANRVHLSYEDFGRNKAVVIAEQMNAVDPYLKVEVYQEGIHHGNISEFLKADLVIEETDDPEMKIKIREEARARGVPVLMMTDLGSAVQVDLRRFDKFPDLTLAPLISDEALYEKRAIWERDKADRAKFFDFAHALIGYHYKNLPELREIVDREKPPMFAGVPQLGSTAMAAGGIAAEITARVLLGYSFPERTLINKFTAETKTEGNRL